MSSQNSKTIVKPKYHLNSQGAFVIENYNDAPTFSNFFPGIAGLWGTPMWAFYVNRGQCLTSFGIEGKDKAMMEFQPANKAYALTSLRGFRTFLKIKLGSKMYFYEPFQTAALKGPYKTKNHMAMTSHDLTLEETNFNLGLIVRVNYFTLPEESHAALVRKLTIENISKKAYDIEVCDGMPSVMPFGLNDWIMKNMSRTAEAWHRVRNIENRAPFYNLRVAISDRPYVEHIHAGHFFLSFEEKKGRRPLLEPLVEPSYIFGPCSDFTRPEVFLNTKTFTVPKKQRVLNLTPCAFGFAKLRLQRGSQSDMVSLYGHAPDIDQMEAIARKTTAAGYIESKARRNEEIISEIKNFNLTASSSKEFNLYCGQTFLDNCMRGGLPISLETAGGKVSLSIFNRKHGDPERDYNHFVLSPTFLSQGNGSYRDVNQNRRLDNWFNTDVKDSDIINFLNLIQPDGYNPLVIKGTMFTVSDLTKIDNIIKESFKSGNMDHIRELLEKGFLPGKLIAEATSKNVSLKISVQEFLKTVLTYSRKTESTEHGEGFWIDHWTYNLDLLESYLALYPEQLRDILIARNVFNFYHNHFHVLPRDHRYLLTPYGCRQLHTVADGSDHPGGHKKDSKLRTKNGEGDIYNTNLLVKLLCLIANKAATFDPGGIGIEMEAGKPGWYDALNGLPGLVGSSVSETFELKRFCLFLLDSIEILELADDQNIKLFDELHAFITSLSDVLTCESDALSYWIKSNDAKEHYRHRVRPGIDGKEKTLSISAIKKFLDSVVAKTDRAIESAKNDKNQLVTYLAHEIVEYQKLDKHNQEGYAFVMPKAFKRRNLPLFLEGYVHALRIEKNKQKALDLYKEVLTGDLYDQKLKMYRVNASLEKESEDIGRARVFPAGWLENGSIWLHMEYKFLLELLRCGLYKEYFENFKRTFVPFLNPEKYGRSILENSSFIVSSLHEDPKLHGRGFVARLSGSTVEVLHMALVMNAGRQPFSLDKKGQLALSLKPILPGWLFTKNQADISFFDQSGQWQKISLPKNTYAFNFLGSTLVVYHNAKRLDTFGSQKVMQKEITLTYPDKRQMILTSDMVTAPYALEIREHKISRIDILLS